MILSRLKIALVALLAASSALAQGAPPKLKAGSIATGAAAANLGFTPLNPANNLTELTNAAAARTSLGLDSLLPGLTSNVSSTGIPGLSGGHWMLRTNPGVFDNTQTLRVDRVVSGTGSSGNTYAAHQVNTWTSVTGAEYEWGFTSVLTNYTNASTGAQNVAVNGTARKSPPPGGVTITTMVGDGATASVAFPGGAIIPPGHSVRITGASPSGFNGTWKVVTSSAGFVTFASTVNASQTVAGTIVDATITGTWGGNFVCSHETGETDPLMPCIGDEVDIYTNAATTDAGRQMVGLQVQAKGPAGSHIGRLNLWANSGGGVVDRAAEINIFGWIGLDFTGSTLTGPAIMLTNNQQIAFDGNSSTGAYGRYLVYNGSSLIYQVPGGTAFSIGDGGTVTFNRLISNSGNPLKITPASGQNLYFGANGTDSVWIIDTAGHLSPVATGVRNFGSSSNKIATVYANNLGDSSNPATLVTANKVTSGSTSDLFLTPATGYALKLGVNGVDDVYRFDTGGFYPTSNNNRTLGSVSYPWSTLYVTNIASSGITSNTTQVSLNLPVIDNAATAYSSGSSATVAAGIDRVIIDGASTPFTLTLPASPSTNQRLIIECGSTYTLTITPNSGQSIKGTTTSCSADQGHLFHYRASNTTWYKDY